MQLPSVNAGRSEASSLRSLGDIAFVLALLSGCQHARSQVGQAGYCPPLRTDLSLARMSASGATTIDARFKQFDSSAIPFARLFVRLLASADSSGRVLAADSSGKTPAVEFSPGRYLMVARALGYGPRHDTIEVLPKQSVSLTVSLSPDPNDRCGLPELIRRPPLAGPAPAA